MSFVGKYVCYIVNDQQYSEQDECWKYCVQGDILFDGRFVYYEFYKCWIDDFGGGVDVVVQFQIS